jgi:hypothetical protein
MATATKEFPVTRTEAEWRKRLTPEQYHIMREHGTEAPGSCALNYEKRAGSFTCAGCDQPLFVSKTKFESGTGWHGAHRGALQPLRQPPRPRVRGRTAADAPALLHERRGDELPGGVTIRCAAGPAQFC